MGDGAFWVFRPKGEEDSSRDVLEASLFAALDSLATEYPSIRFRGS